MSYENRSRNFLCMYAIYPPTFWVCLRSAVQDLCSFSLWVHLAHTSWDPSGPNRCIFSQRTFLGQHPPFPFLSAACGTWGSWRRWDVHPLESHLTHRRPLVWSWCGWFADPWADLWRQCSQDTIVCVCVCVQVRDIGFGWKISPSSSCCQRMQSLCSKGIITAEYAVIHYFSLARVQSTITNQIGCSSITWW